MASRFFKIGLFALIMVSLLFLSSCGGSSSGSERTGGVNDYRIGTQGLDISFLSNSPPAVVYAEDETFPVTVEIRNRGVYPGEDDGSIEAYLFFRGFDKEIIGGLDDDEIVFEEEEAKTRYNPEGGINLLSKEGDIEINVFENSNIDNYNANIMALLCYPYRTFASVGVCVDPNPNKNSEMDTCTPGPVSVGSQGAPVAVTGVNSISQKGKARFVISIENVGGGVVLREGLASDCDKDEIDREDYDKVSIESFSLSGQGSKNDCTPEDEITLIDGKATIICKVELNNDDSPAYGTLMHLELGYDYKTSIQSQVTIRGD